MNFNIYRNYPVIMSKLFLRHGEVHNVKNIMYSDIPGYRLSNNGISQAKKAARHLKNNFNISVIISSPILRARQTSFYVAELLEVEIQISYNLYEWSGVNGWTGTSFDEFSQTQDYPKYQENPLNVTNTIESLHKVYERVNSLYEKSENALFVSHQDTIRAFTYYKTEGEIFNNEKPDHCGIQEVVNGKVLNHNY